MTSAFEISMGDFNGIYYRLPPTKTKTFLEAKQQPGVTFKALPVSR